MGSLPLGKAGVGSAVNDTTRQVGGALGVAVIGSVLASIYGSQVGDFLQGKPVPSGTAGELKQSLGLALAAGKKVPGSAAPPPSTRSSTACMPVCSSPRGSRSSARSIAFIWLPARASYDALADGDTDADTRSNAADGCAMPRTASS